MPRSQPPLTVAITGASGFLGSHVVKQFCDAGFNVRGTVRDKSNTAKVAHLAGFKNLTLYNADLMKDGSFAACFKNVDIVVHTASPFMYGSKDPQKELIDPAVQGTKNVMEAAIACGAKRVVVTASNVAIIEQDAFRNPEKWRNYVFTDDDWNHSSTVEDTPYELSKYLAEVEVWKYKNQIEITTINPSFIIGPSLSNRLDSTSKKTILGLLSGYFQAGSPPVCFGVADVRDVAQAHLLAATKPEAAGERLLLSSPDSFDFLQISSMARPTYNNCPFPSTYAQPVSFRPYFDSSKALKILGMKLRPVGSTVNDMADDFVARGLFTIPDAAPAPAPAKEQFGFLGMLKNLFNEKLFLFFILVVLVFGFVQGSEFLGVQEKEVVVSEVYPSCLCMNGKEVTGADCTDGNAHMCASCNSGYYLVDGTCQLHPEWYTMVVASIIAFSSLMFNLYVVTTKLK